MRMSELREGEAAVIYRLNCGGAFAVRLRDMGFTEGETVQCVRIAALSSPLLYRVKGAEIALRKCDAGLLEVTV